MSSKSGKNTAKKKPQRGRLSPHVPQGVSTPRYVAGQLFASIEHWPKLVLALAVLRAVWKSRVQDLPKMVESLSKALEASAIVGWVVAVCLLLFTVVLILLIVWWYGKELDRVKRKRDECQEKLIQQRVRRSSEP